VTRVKLRHLILALSLALALTAQAKPKKRARARAHVPAQTEEADKNLVDFSVQPFSDLGSHMVALRKSSAGFASWDLSSAMAFGSLAASPHPAKRLFNLRVEAEISGQADSLFPKSSSCTAEDFPRWSSAKAADGQVTAEAVLLYPETDALVLAVNFINHGRSTLKLKPRLVLAGGGDDVDSTATLDAKTGVLTLVLDRSKLVQRQLVESICVQAGSGKAAGIFSATSMKNADNLSEAPLVGLGGFTVALGPAAFSTLRPGQALRFPVAFSIGPDEKEAALPMSRIWTRWALPKGEALSKAQARWGLTAARLPKAVDPKFERLSRAAALTLLMSQYAKRGELRSDMFSQAKGYRDAFFSEGLPMAALGWSELDHGAAEAALLELSSFSAAAPAPVPPHTGEELLLWEASGLPLHGLAAWELYQRDPELARAGDFLKGMGQHLRNECAWWPSHRDGDGNGLYAFADQEERPWYQRASEPSPQAPQGLSGSAELQTYNIALSALVGWQMQAASAMAEAAGEKDESQKLMAESAHIAASLKRNTRSAQGIYEQGLDGLLPYMLGLDQDLPMARQALGQLTRSAEADALPFLEDGLFHPWRAYLMLKTLSLFGEQDSARLAASKILAFMDGKAFYSAYTPSGDGVGAPGDAPTAAAVLECSLERYQQEAFLLADTKAISGRLLQLRSPDGAFYLKRTGLSEAKAPYDTLSLSSTGSGAILSDGAFVLSAEKELRLSLISQWGLDISEGKGQRQLFQGTKRADFIAHANTPYLVKIIK
jgi:hypothetical protein